MSDIASLSRRLKYSRHLLLLCLLPLSSSGLQFLKQTFSGIVLPWNFRRGYLPQAAGRDSSYRLATAILSSLLGQNKFFNRFFAENFLAHAPFFNYKKRIIRQRYEYIVYTPL